MALAAALTIVVGVGGGAGVYFAGEREEAGIERVADLSEVLAANEGPAENYLIVGSDTRDVVDPDAEDAGLFLNGSTGEGGRSDTIMILRRDPDAGASLLSIPRDLWVPIAGTGDDGKINWAYIGGPRRLAETITQALGIPIHHYVEVDFAGFQRLVDEIGGVEICVKDAAQDTNSGLSLQPGCQTLRGRDGARLRPVAGVPGVVRGGMARRRLAPLTSTASRASSTSCAQRRRPCSPS